LKGRENVFIRHFPSSFFAGQATQNFLTQELLQSVAQSQQNST